MKAIKKIQRLPRAKGGYTYFVYFPADIAKEMKLDKGEDFILNVVNKDEIVLRRH